MSYLGTVFKEVGSVVQQNVQFRHNIEQILHHFPVHCSTDISRMMSLYSLYSMSFKDILTGTVSLDTILDPMNACSSEPSSLNLIATEYTRPKSIFHCIEVYFLCGKHHTSLQKYSHVAVDDTIVPGYSPSESTECSIRGEIDLINESIAPLIETLESIFDYCKRNKMHIKTEEPIDCNSILSIETAMHNLLSICVNVVVNRDNQPFVTDFKPYHFSAQKNMLYNEKCNGKETLFNHYPVTDPYRIPTKYIHQY